MQPKKLERPHDGAVVAGVMAGLAKYFNQDPLLFRLVAFAIILFTGFFPGLLLYIVAWVVIPKGSTVEYVILPDDHVRG